jgi:hypothetical protein
MDFLILMVRNVPKIGASGESSGKTEVISWVPEEPSAFPPRAVSLPVFDCKKKSITQNLKGLRCEWPTVSTRSVLASTTRRVDQRYWCQILN